MLIKNIFKVLFVITAGNSLARKSNKIAKVGKRSNSKNRETNKIEPGPPYWSDPRIHTFGNNNWFHALVAPTFTNSLDKYVYGCNLRELALEYFVKPIFKKPKRILDVGCGTGMSSTAVNNVWKDANITAIDTSHQMISCARSFNHRKNIDYKHENGHFYNPETQYDLSTMMFMLHETPQCARIDLLEKLANSSQLTVVIDISTDYDPSEAMLWGEPFLLEYQENIDQDFKDNFKYVQCETLVPNHAIMWIASNQIELK